ncbi:MAG: hypothetical protein GY906_36470 [bacterium]|nr:hypothetical protein [bacterium]
MALDHQHTGPMSPPLPSLIRRQPERYLGYTCRCSDATTAGAAESLDELLENDRMSWTRASQCSWEAELPWRTRVFGVIPREVDEYLQLELVDTDEGAEIRLTCFPQQTHNAHAAGAVGVLLLAAVVGYSSGWPAGIVPGITTVVAGGLFTDVTRVYAFNALERSLKLTIEDISKGLWHGDRGQIESV